MLWWYPNTYSWHENVFKYNISKSNYVCMVGSSLAVWIFISYSYVHERTQDEALCMKKDLFSLFAKIKRNKTGWSNFFGLSGFHKEISPSCEHSICSVLEFPLFVLEGGCVDLCKKYSDTKWNWWHFCKRKWSPR